MLQGDYLYGALSIQSSIFIRWIYGSRYRYAFLNKINSFDEEILLFVYICLDAQ